jgi:DNA-binding XRE family transcriptional regulator
MKSTFSRGISGYDEQSFSGQQTRGNASMDDCSNDPSTLLSSILTYSEHRGRRVCHTQMQHKNAKMGMEGNNESVRGVVGEQKNHIGACAGVRIVPLKNIELLKLGYRIRGARKVLGYSQKVFAAKCGLDRSYLGGVERGERNVTFGILCAICVGLECDIAAITKCIPRPTPPVLSEGSNSVISPNGKGPGVFPEPSS